MGMSQPLSSLVLHMKNGTTAEQNQEGRGLPATRIETISDGSIDLKRVRFVELDEAGVERWKLLHGDILLSHINSVEHIGKSAIYQGIPQTLIHGMNLLLLRPDQNLVLPEYLHFGLRSVKVREHIRARCKRAINQASINQKELGAIELPVPSLEEQSSIVDLLSRAEGIVRLRREAERKAAELIPALFFDMFGDPATNPKGWPVVTLGTVVEEFRYGTSHKSGPTGFPVLRIPNVIGNQLEPSGMKLVEVPSAEADRLRLLDGDFLFVRTNGNPDYVGRSAVYDSSVMQQAGFDGANILYASYLIRARMQPATLEPYFLQGYLCSAEGRRKLKERCRTSAGQFNINTNGLASIPIIIPSMPIQLVFVQHCRDVFSIQSQQSAATAKAQSAFDALLARAFSTTT